MISTTGLTMPLNDGWRNCEAYIADNTPNGTASSRE
jgi:hypothetical protein